MLDLEDNGDSFMNDELVSNSCEDLQRAPPHPHGTVTYILSHTMRLPGNPYERVTCAEGKPRTEPEVIVKNTYVQLAKIPVLQIRCQTFLF